MPHTAEQRSGARLFRTRGPLIRVPPIRCRVSQPQRWRFWRSLGAVDSKFEKGSHRPGVYDPAHGIVGRHPASRTFEKEGPLARFRKGLVVKIATAKELLPVPWFR